MEVHQAVDPFRDLSDKLYSQADHADEKTDPSHALDEVVTRNVVFEKIVEPLQFLEQSFRGFLGLSGLFLPDAVCAAGLALRVQPNSAFGDAGFQLLQAHQDRSVAGLVSGDLHQHLVFETTVAQIAIGPKVVVSLPELLEIPTLPWLGQSDALFGGLDRFFEFGEVRSYPGYRQSGVADVPQLEPALGLVQDPVITVQDGVDVAPELFLALHVD